tara:strand:+ start:182 stop:1207 length:1026 start_codon:yes stop_codon:yes gene_type:complete
MAYYAKISNQEFTVSEYARLREAQQEKNVIEHDNRASDGYVALKNMYYSKNTSDTLEGLQAELNALYSDIENHPAQEDVDALNVAIQAEKDTLAEEGADLVSQMETLEAEGTEALVTEIENLNTAIANALCRVTAMYSGVDEIVMKAGDSSAIQEEINALEESKKEVDYTQDEEVVKAELQAIQDQISAKLEEMRAVPQVEFDNSVYWEGYYGGCKRTSYNTQGGVHKLGGTPFRKNYAGVGYIYDPVRDAFYSQQPYASWTLDESTCYWQPPTPRPEGMDWYWKEDTTEWVDYVYINPDNKQPFPSWIWDTTKGIWEAPTPRPEGIDWYWKEETLTWQEV